jgi:hypothetical protein
MWSDILNYVLDTGALQSDLPASEWFNGLSSLFSHDELTTMMIIGQSVLYEVCYERAITYLA